jgi:hypothetical protein
LRGGRGVMSIELLTEPLSIRQLMMMQQAKVFLYLFAKMMTLNGHVKLFDILLFIFDRFIKNIFPN